MTASKCSKCHVKDKIPPIFPPRALAHFDHWCWACYANAPLLERIPKLSRGKKRKLIEKQQERAIEKAKLRAEFLEQQELKRATAAKNKVHVPRSKSKKGSDLPDTLNFGSAEKAVAPPKDAVAGYDSLRQRILEAQDPTIFDEELPDD